MTKSWEDHLSAADALAADGDDAGALPHYDLSVPLSPQVCDHPYPPAHPLARRALCLERLGHHARALDDALRVLPHLRAPDAAAGSDRHGDMAPHAAAMVAARCWLVAGNPGEAEKAFAAAAGLGADPAACERGTRKCIALRGAQAEEEREGKTAAVAAAESSSSSSSSSSSAAAAAGSSSSSSSSSAPTSSSSSSSSAAPALPRFSYYQSADTVTVDVFVRGADPAVVKVRATEGELHFSHPDFSPLEVRLYAAIDPASLAFDCKKPKVEIRLRKAISGMWSALERPAGASGFGTVSTGSLVDVPEGDTFRPEYPSSSLKKKNWDAIDKGIKQEEEEEKPEGEDALNKLLQGIYANASDETKRAMNKSYQESGGTVLSTNWEDVGKKTVKGSAPKGMVMRKWGTDEVVATDKDPIDD